MLYEVMWLSGTYPANYEISAVAPPSHAVAEALFEMVSRSSVLLVVAVVKMLSQP
jgi:hypothetical protein